MDNKCINCGECCIQTEMILSQQDIELIIQNFPNKLRKKDFIFKNQNGFFQLKNTENHCVFLNTTSKKCTIYEYRPQGCKFYPLIFDFIQNKCIFDKDCPRIQLFYQNREEFRSICFELKQFIRDQLKIDLRE